MQLIKCQLCQKEFKQITNKHLMFSHQLTTEQYKEQFGKDSLNSDEARQKASERSRGENNPNFGKPMSEENKHAQSGRMMGKIAWNKGIPASEEQKTKQSITMLAKNAEREALGIPHPEEGRIHSPDRNEKNRLKQIEYAKDNHEELSGRAYKAVETKKDNGYYLQKRQNTLFKREQEYLKNNIKVTGIYLDQIFELQCLGCETQYTRSVDSAISTVCYKCNSSNHYYEDKFGDELLSIIKDTQIIRNSKNIIPPFELDFYLPEKNIAFEFNGLYWHSESCGKGRWYHRMKFDACKSKGIRLIQIFEDEWLLKKEIVFKRIKTIIGEEDNTIFARKCKLTHLSQQEYYNFCELTHIQGGQDSEIRYGLEFNDQLVGVMAFNHLSRAKGHRQNENSENSWELTRYCSTGRIIGGAGKMLQTFIKSHDPLQIISYADLRWNTGNLYEKIGFVYDGMTIPNYWYIMGNKRIYRYKLRKMPHEDANKTERELRLEQGYKIIWDCGHSKWIWTK